MDIYPVSVPEQSYYSPIPSSITIFEQQIPVASVERQVLTGVSAIESGNGYFVMYLNDVEIGRFVFDGSRAFFMCPQWGASLAANIPHTLRLEFIHTATGVTTEVHIQSHTVANIVF